MRQGERFQAETDKKIVSINWIIRKDEFKALFQDALAEEVKNDVPILSPEWLVILKFIAERFKDQKDAVYLLSKKRFN